MVKQINTVCWLVFFAAVQLVFACSAFSAAKRPATFAELALYSGADRQQILEEGARKEGKLTFYTTGQLTQAVRPKVNAFQKKYPYIKVEFWHAQTTQLLPRIFEEYSANRYIVDIIEITQGGQLVMEEKGFLQPFYSPNLAFIEEGAVRKAAGGGAFAAGHYKSGYGIGYNTKLITREELPKSYRDLLDPKWKGNGKVAISVGPPSASWVGAMLVTYGEDFVKQIAKQDFNVHAVTARAVLDMVINGEYLFSPTQSDAHVSESKKNGAPVDWVPLEPVPMFLGQMVLPKRPACPHAALLFMDFDLSKEAGEIYKDTGYVSPRKDVSGATTYKKYYGPFSTKQFEQWNDLLAKLFVKR